jgi:hypothetical protein
LLTERLMILEAAIALALACQKTRSSRKGARCSMSRSRPRRGVTPLNFASMLQDEPADVGQLLIAPIFLGKPGAGARSPSAMGSGETA